MQLPVRPVAATVAPPDRQHDRSRLDPATPAVAALRLTTDGRCNGNPDWSPDGTKIGYDGWGTAVGHGSG